MEIKVSDKVRVREDAPRIYTQNCLNLSLHNTDFEVTNIDGGCANIQNKDGILTIAYVIPTKYLTKVEDEAKEPKFKVGGKVKDIPSPHDSGIYKVDDIKKSSDGFLYHIQGLIGKSNVKESDLAPYTEPTAPTIKVGDMVIVKPDAPNMCKSVDVFKHIKSVVTKIENGKATLDIDRLGDGGLELFDVPLEYIQKVDAIEHLHNHGWGDLGKFTSMPMSVNQIIGFELSYWLRYEADLAKEIALKVANKYNDPKEAADYAVSVAKAVVENLKKK